MEAEDIKTLTKELGEAKAKLEKQQGELQEAHKIAMKAVEDAKSLNKDQGENIDRALKDTNETGLQVKELAQQVAEVIKTMKEGPKGQPTTLRSRLQKAVDEVTDSKALLEKMSKGSGSMRIKTVANVDRTATAGLTLVPYIDDLVSLTRQPLTIRALLNVIPVNTDSIKYGVQSTRTNNAATVPEGTQKPYSTYAWTSATAGVEVIAHLAKMTLQAIADAPRLVAEIEAEMRFGLALEEERQILLGRGATVNELDGLWRNATEYLTPTGANTGLILNEVDRLRMALLQLQLAYAAPNGIVLNPTDIANIELIRRDTGTTGGATNTGGYIFGNPDKAGAIPTLWGVPLVSSPALTVGSFLTGAFDIAANLYQREGVEVLISTENANDFELNLATMRCELREGLAVRRPWALVKGLLGTTEGS